ncbi:MULTISPECIES: hypothetical protein [Nocardia]|uniref:hypothetical protein n=1 Tax=Nocardia TaxID=1817 RepID=UPI000D69663D|nr:MULTISPECIES: hypothetical protein [Nocardia]
MATLRRFWIELDLPALSWLGQGIGVTAFDVRDCLSMVAELFGDEPMPPVRRITVDISLAEPPSVSRRYLGVSVWRGVWYPPQNLETGPNRDIDRRGAPVDYPTPVTQRRVRASETLRTKNTWWDEIPHIGNLLWPLVQMHNAENARRMRYDAPHVRTHCVADPTYGYMLREALDFMIAWQPTPDEWFDPTGIRFADQRDLEEYLRAFRDYVSGDRPEPIYPPGSEPLSPEEAVRRAMRNLVINPPEPEDLSTDERLSPDAKPRLPMDE